MTLKQGLNKPFMAYDHCFNEEAMQVDDYTDQAAFQIAMNGLQLDYLKWEMSKKMPKTLSGRWKRPRNTPL